MATEAASGERLQKVLSASGVTSRRQAEQLIVEGRVRVNGVVVDRLGSRANPSTDRITVDGREVRPPEEKCYLLLYKPRGYVSSMSDPEGRPTIKELLPRKSPRLFHVGRLDFNTEGLILLTNDGELAQLVSHPRHGISKLYAAKVSGIPSEATLERLRSGVVIDGVRTAPAQVEVVRATRGREGNAWLSVTLFEGRCREVRKMLAAVGHPVSKLKRVQIGPITDRGLSPGRSRDLTAQELRQLRRMAAGEAAPARPAARRRGPDRKTARKR